MSLHLELNWEMPKSCTECSFYHPFAISVEPFERTKLYADCCALEEAVAIDEQDWGAELDYLSDRRLDNCPLREIPPTADVVEVVRCRDCTWWKSIFSWNGKEHKVCVRESAEPPKESDDYCSYGERREDECID